MSELKELIEKERQRDTVQKARVMYFYKEGSFMRAYEWSAWLWCKYVKDFSPTHRKAKQVDGTIIHIGCPVTSLSKHLPEGASNVFNEDGSASISLPETLIPDDTDLAAMASEAEQWKQSFPVAEPAKKKPDTEGVSDAFPPQSATITGLMQQILAFPVEKKSPMECAEFLSDLKIQLAKLI